MTKKKEPFEKRHVNLNKLRNFLSNTASADLIRKFEAELVIGFFDCVEVDAQSPPVAQVEVYRKALEELWAWKESDTVKGWFQMAHIHGSRVSEEIFKKVEDMNSRIKALLTSKPEPVAPVRKWEAEEEK